MDDKERKYMRSKTPQERKAFYIQHGGVFCWHCFSYELEDTGPVKTYWKIAKQDMVCLGCGATWTDVYQLVEVQDDGDESDLHSQETSPD